MQKGYKNVYKIYNGFETKDFDISEEDVLKLNKQYNLADKPIIYLGNCQKAKGVVESCKALKDLDVYLVTSGRKQAKIPTLNLEFGLQRLFEIVKSVFCGCCHVKI